MSNSPGITRLKNILKALSLLLTSSLTGLMLGLLVVRFLIPPKAMGWDGIADALGGAMLGGLTGIAAAVTLLLLQPAKSWLRSTLAITLALLLSFGLLALTAPDRTNADDEHQTKTTQP